MEHFHAGCSPAHIAFRLRGCRNSGWQKRGLASTFLTPTAVSWPACSMVSSSTRCVFSASCRGARVSRLVSGSCAGLQLRLLSCSTEVQFCGNNKHVS